MRSVVRPVLCCLLLLAVLTSCREAELRTFIDRPQDIREIQCARRHADKLEVVSTLTEPGTIARILSGVQVGREEPYTRHPFRYLMIIVKKDGSKMFVDFEDNGHHAAIRLQKKQYGMSKSTADLIQSFYIGSDNEDLTGNHYRGSGSGIKR